MAYADDLILGVPRGTNIGQVLDFVGDLLKLYGLKINKSKCTTTANGGEVKFLGQIFTADNSYNIADQVRDELNHCLDVLNWASCLDVHVKYQIFRRVILAKVTWAPFVDMRHDVQDEYTDIDNIIIEYFRKIFNMHDAYEMTIKNLLLAPEEAGGLQLMLPGEYFEIM